MIIEIGTKMLIHNTDRGEFYAKARRTFSLDDEVYPVVITDPMETSAVMNQEADLRAAATHIELVEEEIETITDGDVVIQPMVVEIEPEEKIPPCVGIKMDSDFVCEPNDIVAEKS